MTSTSKKRAAPVKLAPKQATPEDRRWAARAMVDGTVCAAVTVGYVGSIGAGAADVHDLRSFVADTVREVAAGDLSALEEMLLQQSVTLQAIFADLALKAKAQTSRDNLQTLTTLALKAAAGSRQAIVALAELRAPKSVMFARQANLTSGPQQINNGVVAQAPRAEEMQNRPNELLRCSMASSWTPERRARQAELIGTWKPWTRATGPVTPEGKATASRNAWKGGHRQMLRELTRMVNAEVKAGRDLVDVIPR